MGFFKNLWSGKKKSQAEYDRPAWMTDGMTVSLLEGSEDLEVVGESYYQDELWAVVGGRSTNRVRQEIAALLVPEPDNQYDSNAIAVWAGGVKVGHLSRNDAARMLEGLLALERTERTKIALNGVIVGGGMRDDGPGMLGVFLKFDPEDFGLAPPRSQRQQSRAESGPRTGLSTALMADEGDDAFDLSWFEELSDNDMKAITQLRKLLVDESDPIDLHFMYAELERRLYKSRDVFASALDEYDTVCEQHDAEMDSIRPELVRVIGSVPLLETYKQQTIRQQKAKDFEKALWWTERGIELYGDDASRQSFAQDLRSRRDKLTKRMEKGVSSDSPIETLTCHTCGAEFQRKRSNGRKPHECPDCRDGN